MDQLRQKVVDEAKTWLRTPWMHEARIKGAGVDCAMFIKEVFVSVGLVPQFDVGSYPTDWMLHRSEERFLFWLDQYGTPIESPLPGDVAVWRHGRTYSHGAIVLDWPLVIHAYRPERSVVLSDVSKLTRLRAKPVLFRTIFTGEL
jgi:cell wall-associated NlpC family hydrolase